MGKNSANDREAANTDGGDPGAGETVSQCLDDIIADYLQRREAGEQPDRNAYLRRFPQYCDDLKEFFQNQAWVGADADPAAFDCGESLVGVCIGNYRLKSLVARGGMGIVYRAIDEKLRREAAIKLIAAGNLADDESLLRFRTEAESAGRLQHPGILPVFAVGQWQGHAYYAMPWIDGPSLESLVRKQIEPSEAARIVRDLAVAVGHAHAHGVVHRDIKPANVLLDCQQRPLLIDFGLAKLSDETTGHTRTGQVLGTPNYMSPEQAAGRGEIGFGTDVYGIGGVLYALLSGVPPHTGDSPVEVLQAVMTDEPPPLSKVTNRAIPRDLRTICMRCLAFEPHERYATATAVAEDLQQFLDGEPITSSSSHLAGRLLRPIQRDHHARHFRSWGVVLLILGLLICAAHVGIFVLERLGWPPFAAFMLPRLLMFGAIAGVILTARGGSLAPRTIAERPIWAIWLGYLAALLAVNIILWQLQPRGLHIIPFAAALSGFGFIAMAGHVWGACYLIGGGFLILATLLPLLGPADSLGFGFAWLAALAVLGWRYR